MQHLYTIAIASVITFLSLFGAYNYMPLPVDTVGEQMLGTAITTISGSDKMKDFPTTYNANLAALNAGKIEIGTTSLPLITDLDGLTTAGSLATVGTIGTGVWQGTDVGVAYGGTGVSTLTAYGVLLGNSASAISTVSGLGTADQVLTSNGAGAAPTWQSTVIDETANYSWTGDHVWGTGSTTFNGINYFNGYTELDDVLIGSSTAPTPTLDQNVANKAYVDSGARLTHTDFTEYTRLTGTNTTEATSTSYTVPAGTLDSNDALRVTVGGEQTGASNTFTIRLYIGGVLEESLSGSNGKRDKIVFDFYNTSASAQKTDVIIYKEDVIPTIKDLGAGTIDTTSDFLVEITNQPGNTSDEYTIDMFTVEKMLVE